MTCSYSSGAERWDAVRVLKYRSYLKDGLPLEVGRFVMRLRSKYVEEIEGALESKGYGVGFPPLGKRRGGGGG